MARYPGGRWNPLPENATQSAIRPTQIILHTAVDAPGKTNLQGYFARTDVSVESHFWTTLGGETDQMMDTEVRADANRYANRRPDGTGAISIETEDEGDPVGVPWSDAQLIELERIIRWCAAEHGIPLVKCATPDSPGLGYHAMWGAPSAWTPSAGKTCPGPTRIRQFHEILLPRLQEAPMYDTPMPENQARELSGGLYEAWLGREADAGGLAHWTGVGTATGPVALITGFIVSARAEMKRIRLRDAETASALAADVKGLRKELDALKVSVEEVRKLDRSGSTPVDVDAIAEAVSSRIIERLTS